MPITDELVDELAKKAEAGYDVERCFAAAEDVHRSAQRRPAWSPCASSPSCARHWLSRAKRDHETTSSVIRKALREYLKVA